MKMTKFFWVFFACATVLFTGCGCDDSELWAELDKQAAQIDELLEWQANVNGQISSLQNLVAALEANDCVVGVVPVTQDGVEVGYTITFAKSSPITIHRVDGHSPAIGVAQDTDGKYYWTLDGGWLTDDGTPSGNKMPVAGIDGSTPAITIGENGNWYVDSVDTGVKAAGENGQTGMQGDAIFAADGVDNTNADYVIFTLANGKTKITLPKYKGLSMKFPDLENYTLCLDVYGKGEIAYTTTGNPVGIGIVSATPQGWEITMNEKQSKISIERTDGDFSTKILVVITAADGTTASYWLRIILEVWARSNIVWDASDSKLTFAVSPAQNATIPANSQGVFFKRGSLVAISPAALTGTEAAYASGQYSEGAGGGHIIYSPAGTYDYTWANIPYGGSMDGFVESTNDGDICRYISAQDWVEGEWRMPTWSEINALMTEGSAKVGRLNNIPNGVTPASAGDNGHYGLYPLSSGYFFGDGVSSTDNTQKPPGGSTYFPASGYRNSAPGDVNNAGGTGYYWSTGQVLYFGSYGPQGTNLLSGNAFPVRCIRE